ncbi:MAG: hypothetical protein SXV54_24900 [Chloroflexota bacterium]|nr:hypothetical protein [Chloroflexota bacterium]
MSPVLHLDFDPHNADHRRAAEWLSAQPDPAEAVVRLIRAANEGQRRLQQWEKLATLLAKDLRKVRSQMTTRPPNDTPKPEISENPESARRLDSMFKSNKEWDG